MVVNDCSESRKKLQWKVFDWLTKQHPTSGVMVTAAMPVAYVEEVTALHICSSYKGTVIVHRGYHVGKDCTRCDGVDRIKQVLAHDGVWNSVCQHLDSLVPKSFTCSTMTSIWGWLIFCTQKREVLLSYALQFKIQMRLRILMFEAVNPAAMIFGNFFGGLFLGIALFFSLLYVLTGIFSSVDTITVAIVGGVIIFLLFLFGFEEYMNSLMYSKVAGLQGAVNKFVGFISSALFLGGTVAGFGGAYKLNS